MRVNKAILLGFALVLVGCNEEPKELVQSDSTIEADSSKTEKEIVSTNIGMDSSYMSACNSIRSDEQNYLKCKSDKAFRENVAVDLAKTSSKIIIDLTEKYGEEILAESLSENILSQARAISADSVPRHLVGIPVEQVDLPKYFILEGAIFGYRSRVGLSSLIVDDGYEVMLEVDRLSIKQQQFLEEVCIPENDWKAANCQGEIYIGIVAGNKSAHLSVIGAKLIPLTEEFLVKNEMQKMW